MTLEQQNLYKLFLLKLFNIALHKKKKNKSTNIDVDVHSSQIRFFVVNPKSSVESNSLLPIFILFSGVHKQQA